MTRTPLTVHNAEIRTATVEVKTLTISGKQVTLAVFRQLPLEQLLASDGHLAGEPWGWVNHHPDKGCASAGLHRHFVWQRGNDLRRSFTSEPTWTDEDPVFVTQELQLRLVQCALAEGWTPPGTRSDLQHNGTAILVRGLSVTLDSTVFCAQPVASFLWPSDQGSSRYFAVAGGSWSEAFALAKADDHARATAQIEEAAKKYGGLEAAASAVDTYISKERDRRQRQWAAWDALLTLPQLFIAV